MKQWLESEQEQVEEDQWLPAKQPLPGEKVFECPVVLAAGLRDGAVLEVMMRLLPSVWQQESQIRLLRLLLKTAMDLPSEECVALLIHTSVPLQRRLLPLMLRCVETQREALLPIFCAHARVDFEQLDEDGNTILHALARLAMQPGKEISGVTLLRSLLTSRPNLHLFATSKEGLTALGATPPTAGVFPVLLNATRNAVAQSIVAIVCCRREQRSLAVAALSLQDVLEASFPGLTVCK